MVNNASSVEQARKLMADSIWRSTIIEGLYLSYPTVESILRNESVPACSNDILFVQNMGNAWDFLFDSLGLPNNLAMLREFNKLCGLHIIEGSGDLRHIDVIIKGCKYKPAIPSHPDVVASLQMLNSIKDPQQRAIALFCYVARDQLFIDGNKRVAQLIMNKVLIENGVGILYINADDIDEFMDVLVGYYETDDPVKIFRFLNKSIRYFNKEV